ncbi:uncharacterized protein LOC142241908 [Haematobia irritans]|uniref:uncharacterized protein LOC142241908 n=1 Tax=Haematobia irritans TaxID=7368 RepID=UPI003F50B9BD
MHHQTSLSAMKTLKGIFQEPKMNHRRDFLRENKLNLRELQKNTTHKLVQQQQEQEKKEQKHLHRYHKNNGTMRRSESLQRYGDIDKEQYQSNRMTTSKETVAPSAIKGQVHHNQRPLRRSYSQQRTDSLQQTIAKNGFDTPTSNNQGDHRINRVPRSTSAVSIISKAESCDKEIQTEDILDEEFLYEALKKCNSTEVDFSNKNIRDTTARSELHSNSYGEQKYLRYNSDDNKSHEHVPYDYKHRDEMEDRRPNDQISNFTARSQYTEMDMGNKVTSTMEHQHQNNCNDEFQENFQNLHINTNIPREKDIQSSARSRQTTFSNGSKRKSNGNYKLGSRDEIRLPRYLEKEKREKEEERQRVMAQDPNCPYGHYALSEEERLALLNGSKKKMESLVQELNRMPMTTETLRIRRRKVEIEKELSQIELDIRAFSKPKVYVPTSGETPIPY